MKQIEKMEHNHKANDDIQIDDEVVIQNNQEEDQIYGSISIKNEEFWGWVNDLSVTRSRSTANRTFIEKQKFFDLCHGKKISKDEKLQDCHGKNAPRFEDSPKLVKRAGRNRFNKSMTQMPRNFSK